jgi:T5SS/PEP-CTERM-associated repeat protein
MAAGVLDIDNAGIVIAESMTIGLKTGSQGSVAIRGAIARLLIATTLTVGDGGASSLAVDDGGLVSVGIGMLVTGNVSLAGGRIETDSLVLNTGSSLVGHGRVIAAASFSNSATITAHHQLTLIGDIANSGLISTTPGSYLRCIGALTGTGTLVLGVGSVASLEAVSVGQTINFTGGDSKIILRNPGQFLGVVHGFGINDSIEVDFQVGSLGYTPGVLQIIDNFLVVRATVQIIGPYTLSSFTTVALPLSRTLINFV